MVQYYIISPQTYDDQFWWKKDDIEFWKEIITSNNKVLELASGTGRIGLPLIKNDVDYTGLDISDDYVNFANLKFANYNPFIQGDMKDFQLKTNYDVIFIGFNSLLHLLSEKDFLMCLNSIKKHMHSKTKLYIDLFVPHASFLYRDESSKVIVMEFFDSQQQHLSIIEETLSYNDTNEIVSVKWRYKNKTTNYIYNIFDFKMKIYYPDSINRILSDAGLNVINLWGSYNKDSFTDISELQIYEIGLF